MYNILVLRLKLVHIYVSIPGKEYPNIILISYFIIDLFSYSGNCVFRSKLVVKFFSGGAVSFILKMELH